MNNLHYLTLSQESKVKKIRDAILSQDFSGYFTAIKKAENVKEELIKLEEMIFGTCSDIDIHTDIYFQYKLYGHVVISPISNTITVNVHNFVRYENGCVLQQENIESKAYNFNTIIPSYENIIKTLRILHKKKSDQIKKEIENYTDKLFKEFKEENPKEFAEGTRPSVDMMFNPDIKNIYSKSYELERFWDIFIANIDIISFISELLKSHIISFNDLTPELITKIKSTLQGVLNLIKLPSNSEMYTNYIKQYSSIDDSVYDILEFFNIMSYELIRQEEELKKHSEYSEMMNEYLNINKQIINFEKKYFK